MSSDSLAAPGPIFIMGNHRSGTTWLHLLLAETGGFAYVTAFHVIAYSALGREPADVERSPAYQSVVETFNRLGLDRRVIDEVAVSPRSPEEYGSILSNAGTGGRITPRNLSLFHELCGRVLRLSGSSKPLILKNPWDYSNFVYIKSAIPNARFVFIHRHPERVLHSSLNAARAVLANKDPYYALLVRDYDRLFSRPLRLCLLRLLTARRFDLGIRAAINFVGKANSYFVTHVNNLATDDYVSIRYEDLCSQTPEVLEDILRFCVVDPSTGLAPRTPPRPRSSPLLPEVARHTETIARRMAPYMQLHRYEAGGRVLSPVQPVRSTTP